MSERRGYCTYCGTDEVPGHAIEACRTGGDEDAWMCTVCFELGTSSYLSQARFARLADLSRAVRIILKKVRRV